MMLLHPTLLLPVLIGCSLASFISPHYVTSYSYGIYPVPGGEGSGNTDPTSSPAIDTTLKPQPQDPSIDVDGAYAIPAPTMPARVYKMQPNGRLIVTNCNLCRLCCIGRNLTYTLESINGNDQNQGNNPQPKPQDETYITSPYLTPAPEQEAYRTAPSSPGPPAPWSYPIPPLGGPYPPGLPASPATVPAPGPYSGPAPAPSPGPASVPPQGPTPWSPAGQTPGKMYYPSAPGQYATAAVQTVPTTQASSPCTTTTTTLATIGTPCFTPGPPAASSTVPSIPPAVTSAPTQPTGGYRTIQTTQTTLGYATSSVYATSPPLGYQTAASTIVTTPVLSDSYAIPETIPWWTTSTAPPPAQTTTRGTGNGSINEGCFIDLRSIEATVTCGVSTGSKGCCSQLYPSTQRQIQINFQLLARYFGQIPSKIECKQAVEIGLVQSTDIMGVCNQYSPIPTVFPSTFATPAPEISVPTAGPGAYVVPNTGGSNSFSIVTSFLTIIMATVLCI